MAVPFGFVSGPPVKEETMRQLILAAAAVLGLGVGSAYAQSYAHSAPPAASQQGLAER
jgi:hypothetical protein